MQGLSVPSWGHCVWISGNQASCDFQRQLPTALQVPIWFSRGTEEPVFSDTIVYISPSALGGQLEELSPIPILLRTAEDPLEGCSSFPG